MSIQATAKKTLPAPNPADWNNRVNKADNRANVHRPALEGGIVS